MISIVIASYNQQEYLPDAIESVFGQSESPRELIIIEDGSTDNSLDIARKYLELSPPTKTTTESVSFMSGKLAGLIHIPVQVISQVNKGLASARNTGIMNAKGDWILFLDADDMLQDNCIQRLEEEIKKHPEADIIAPSFKCFGLSQDKIILGANPTLEDFKEGNRIGYFSAIRKKKLLEIGGYSPRMIFGFEDFHLWFNLLLRGAKIVTIPEVLVLYRVKEHSMIHEANAHREELIAQINKDFHLDIR